MFKVVEMPTASVISESSTLEDAISYIENIESSSKYAELLAVYGSTRRIQQELAIENN